MCLGFWSKRLHVIEMLPTVLYISKHLPLCIMCSTCTLWHRRVISDSNCSLFNVKLTSRWASLLVTTCCTRLPVINSRCSHNIDCLTCGRAAEYWRNTSTALNVSADGKQPWDAEQQVLSEHTPYGEWAALTAYNGFTNGFAFSPVALLLIFAFVVDEFGPRKQIKDTGIF